MKSHKIKNKLSPTEQKRKDEFQKKIAESNGRIVEAIDVLIGHERGKAVLKQLKQLFDGPATGLDTAGLSALKTLVNEFTDNHRRSFIP